MGSGDATATGSLLSTLVHSGMTTTQLTEILDYTVYPIVNAWIGGHTLENHTGIVTSCELIMGMWFVRQRDPQTVSLPGQKIQFSSFAEAEKMCKGIISQSLNYRDFIKVVDPADYEQGGYVLRDSVTGARRSKSPPL